MGSIPAETIPPKAPYKNWPNDAAFDSPTTSPTPTDLRIIGTFPRCVSGTLYRTGPAHYKVQTPNGTYARHHWFDGFTQIHRFEISHAANSNSDGDSTTAGPQTRVTYTSRSQCDELLEEARRGRNLDTYVTFGQKRDPCMSYFEKVKCLFKPADPGHDHPKMQTVGVTVRPGIPGHGEDVVVALTDNDLAQHLDRETLEPIGVTRQSGLHPDLKGPLSSAHAAYDPETGDLYNFNLDFGRNATYRVFSTSASTGKTSILATITGTGIKPAYIHSFFLSGDFIILCVWPLYFQGHGAAILWERNVIDEVKFNREAKCQWYVVDRRANGRGLVASFESESFFAFHSVNAFQEESSDTAEGQAVDVLCDVVKYEDDHVMRNLYYENVLSTGSGAAPHEGARPTIVRYKLGGIPKAGPKKKGVSPVEVVRTIEQAVELPTINPRFATKRQRYVYGIVDRGYSSFVDGLGKTDLETGEIKYWGMEPKPHTPGEAVFVPDADAEDESEDAGYLLSVVLDGEKGTSYLVCLDARTMTEVARAECDHAISFGLHGVHLREKL